MLMPGNERRSHNPIRFENRGSQGDQHGGFDVLHLEACATVHVDAPSPRGGSCRYISRFAS